MTRLAVAVAVTAGAAAVCAAGVAGASPTTPASVSAARLPVLVLPVGAYGPQAAKLPIDSRSGVTTNADAARRSLDPGVSSVYLSGIGRVTGYTLTFTSSSMGTARGLVSVTSAVQLFRRPVGPSLLQRRIVADARSLRGKRLAGGATIGAAALFSPAGVGRGAVGLRIEVLAGGLRIWETTVSVRSGNLLADVEVARRDDANENAFTSGLARALTRRIGDVLAGRITPTAVVLPASTKQTLGGLGRPKDGPDLSAMGIAPGDFSSGAGVIDQAYARNPDDVAEYTRNLRAGVFRGTHIRAVSSDVELLPSTIDARGYLSAIRGEVSGSGGAKLLRQSLERFAKTTLTAYSTRPASSIAAGAGAFVVSASGLAGDTRMHLVLAAVNVGPIVTTLTMVTSPGVPTDADIATLVGRAATRAR